METRPYMILRSLPDFAATIVTRKCRDGSREARFRLEGRNDAERGPARFCEGFASRQAKRSPTK